MIYNWLIKRKKSAYGIAIGFLIFTILVYAFQSHWFVRHIYKYIDYWAIPLSAAFMLVLAYMAYISITENRRIREEVRAEEYKTKVLKEIRDWALEILICNFGGKISLTPGISETVQKQAQSVNRLLKCQELSVKGKEYIEPIAFSLRCNLDNYVEEVISSLDDVRNVIIEYGKNIDDPKRKMELDKVERTLQHLIKGLINLTAEYEVMNAVES